MTFFILSQADRILLIFTDRLTLLSKCHHTNLSVTEDILSVRNVPRYNHPPVSPVRGTVIQSLCKAVKREVLIHRK